MTIIMMKLIDYVNIFFIFFFSLKSFLEQNCAPTEPGIFLEYKSIGMYVNRV